ncbi:MAG: phenyltransferase domain-containing protein [Desulfobacteraceae bacterium]|nr:MAG: phenyltransferase domain-containing protein [Desulfobacteraceae bacterium]
MTRIKSEISLGSALNIASVAQLIASLQRPDGDIPWHVEGKTDPWDLVESIMGLNIGGYTQESYRAFEWLRARQNADGSWYSSYVNSVPKDRTSETHMAAYIAVGLLHTWLITRDKHLLEKMFPVMEKGIEFALSLQTDGGEIFWAKSPEGKTDPMSLLAGSSSIYMSLKCALAVARILGKTRPDWAHGFNKLEASLQNNIQIYNISKSRYSMYWFYPVLCGAITAEAGEQRIEKFWNKYMIEGQGARCVSDQPWVTIAETSELVLALTALGKMERAQIVFSWIVDRTFEDDTFWCGYTYPDMVIWPEEKISWTNAVVLMAADALYGITPASGLFSHELWDGFEFKG